MLRDQWANLARMPGLHLYSFSKDILGFLMTTESPEFCKWMRRKSCMSLYTLK